VDQDQDERDDTSTARETSEDVEQLHGSRSARMFGREAAERDEIQRVNRRRIALLGLATGGVMALIVLVCILLLFLAVSRGG
jgi:hypothetical protein